MKSVSAHEAIKGQIVAFLFNTRADVLRDEMYRALCLHVLNEAGMPCTVNQITELVAYAISPTVEVSESLKTIIIEEISTLLKRGEIINENGNYTLKQNGLSRLPNTSEEQHIKEEIFNEIKRVAQEINPLASKHDIETLYEFYSVVCELIALDRVAHIIRSRTTNIYQIEYDDLSELVERTKTDLEIDKIIDVEKFLQKCFCEPSEKLANYLLTTIKVNIILKLLAWDPSLKHLQNTVLKGKTIYLDTSILFTLMLATDPLHEFLKSLISASIKELGVTVKVHEITIKEYEMVIKGHTLEFQNEHKHLRELIAIIKKDNVEPKNVISNHIFADYVTNHSDHIDLGSWQRYTNRIGVDSLFDLFEKLGVDNEVKNAFVPQKEFSIIRENMERASIDQVRRGKRSITKSDVTHDSQLFYLIYEGRHRSSELSFGYDTYLLTLDGSLIHFAKYQGISWLDTYFMFPSQWYEITFPFLRMKINDYSQVLKTYSSMAFPDAFSKLGDLIPLHIFGYVFDHGGKDLSLHSVQNIIDVSMQERVMERLDPANKNLRERQEAELRLERMIADKVLEEKKVLEKLSNEKKGLEKRNEQLAKGIEEQKKQLENLDQKATIKEAEVTYYDTQIQNMQHISDIYRSSDELRDNLESEYNNRLSEVNSIHHREMTELKTELIEKEEMVSNQEEKLRNLEVTVNEINDHLKRTREEKESEKKNREKQLRAIKKGIITTLMVFGIVMCLIFLIQTQINVYLLSGCVVVLILGTVLYHWLAKPWWSFIFYGLGLVATAAIILQVYNLETLLWAIPMTWEVLIFGVDRIFNKQENSSRIN